MNQLNKGNIIFASTITVFYFLLSLLGILHHEIWLDEAHSYLIARDSNSFSDLMYNIRLEGHPIIWYMVLWLLKKITYSVFAMQLLHILIGTANIFLIMHFSPFKHTKKILFAFSYYFFYEYNIISRNYVICMLCTTIFCILICKEKRNYILLAFTLAILANTHFIGLLLAFSLAITMLILSFYDKNHNKVSIRIATYLVLIIGFSICIYQVFPVEETMFSKVTRPNFFSFKRWGAFTSILKGLYQFPQMSEKFWNTNLFTENKVGGAVLSVIVLGLVIRAFINKPLSLFIIISSYISISLFLFSMLMHNYTVRHWGFVFLGFYTAVWFSEGLNQETFIKRINNIINIPLLNNQNISWREWLIYTALGVQFLAGAYLYYMDINKPFSNAKSVANFIQQNNYKDDVVIVSNFTSGPAVSAYLNKKIYYPECHQFGSFGIWNTFPPHISKEELLKEVHSLKNKGYKRAIMALDKNEFPPLKNKSDQIVMEDTYIKIKYLKNFKNGIGGNENYDVFLVIFK